MNLKNELYYILDYINHLLNNYNLNKRTPLKTNVHTEVLDDNTSPVPEDDVPGRLGMSHFVARKCLLVGLDLLVSSSMVLDHTGTTCDQTSVPIIALDNKCGTTGVVLSISLFQSRACEEKSRRLLKRYVLATPDISLEECLPLI